jgi:hypothetical protein
MRPLSPGLQLERIKCAFLEYAAVRDERRFGRWVSHARRERAGRTLDDYYNVRARSVEHFSCRRVSAAAHRPSIAV